MADAKKRAKTPRRAPALAEGPAKKARAKKPPAVSASPEFRQRLVAALKGVLPLEFSTPNGLVALRYELAEEPSFTEEGFSARLRLRHFGDGRPGPFTTIEDSEAHDEQEIKRLEARLKELTRGKRGSKAILAVYEALLPLHERRTERLQARLRPRAPSPRDGDEEVDRWTLLTRADLQHEPRCLDALTRWPESMREAFDSARRPRWNRHFHHLVQRFGARTERDAAYATWKAKQPDREQRWRATLKRETDDALALFPAVSEKFLRTFGLRLPWHFAAYVAFHNAVSRSLSLESHELVPMADGITRWFDRDALWQEPDKDPREERVMALRYYSDPPESVSFGHAGVDWVHWCFLYDAPAAFPVAIVVIDRGYTADLSDALTALDALRESLAQRSNEDNPDLGEDSSFFQDRYILELMNDVRDLETELLARDGIDRRASVPLTKILGGYCPQLPGCTTKIPKRPTNLNEVLEAYERSPDTVAEWIEYARRQLKAGDAGPAWIVGHELHACGKRFNAASIELLEGAYTHLNRPQFTEIARIHQSHRHLSDE